ncbi:DNA topoisomerase I, bacterial [Thermanaerovibrio velox DSM 12556]|uniref:DNA topoisomerase 1 n=1 Tax=Thermanaerovibrio velox DSM 12556 TaxID=926567 RepID=H0UPN3_9BACT|nr:type I DNA topoisomerase [Thermanaerovibrio velox]EHM09580.1 DNA topoisomerase I, bacterial [Thermanaerovibrio velox DSM 12556]
MAARGASKAAGASSGAKGKRSSSKGSAEGSRRRSKLGGAPAGGTLVVVESPTKARSLGKMLGAGYTVEASLGHVMDLPKGRLGVDVDNRFEPEYIQVRGKAQLIKRLKELAKGADRVLLASDPDREGEAIAWHLGMLLGVDIDSPCRVRVHEITPSGVAAALEDVGTLDMNKVFAQQARRVLDRLVGYKLSPLLWSKLQRGLSAGRVQSVALRLVCERQDEIDAFVPEEYWQVEVEALSDDGRSYTLKLEREDGRPVRLKNRDEAERVRGIIYRNPLVVSSFKSREGLRRPMPPFKTSTLQQEASRRLGYGPRRTMRIAQSLFEGVEIPGRGPVGLITYMRTDSLRLSDEAVGAFRAYVAGRFGDGYLSKEPNQFSQKGRSQDAHEAIRPTDVFLEPEALREHLTPEQYRLYDLIWRRAVASQMADAKVRTNTLEVQCGTLGLKCSGVEVLFEGWGGLWPLGVKDRSVPSARLGEELKAGEVRLEQRFTQPPGRYTEAGLIKELEEKGIGRPSTYATIIETLSDRGYVDRDEEKRLAPTTLGRYVNAFLVRHFPEVVQVDFTARMEDQLDRIEAGELEWRRPIEEFYGPFEVKLEEVQRTADRMSVPPEQTGESCPECGKPLVIKRGRFGEFVGCSGYPECRFTKRKETSTGVKCPKCGEGVLVMRKASKGKGKGRSFYGCSRYPECDYASWKKPSKGGDVTEVSDEV